MPGFSAVLWGDGPDRHAVAAILDAEAPAGRVILGGRLQPGEVQVHMAECDALLLLSDYEGLPIAVLEAMACGVVPICLAMRSGIPDLVEDGVTGLVVPDRDEGAIAALRRLAEDPSLRGRLGEAARARVVERYSVNAMVDGWDVMLREVAAAANPSPLKLPDAPELSPIHPALACEDWRMPSVRSSLRGRVKRCLHRILHPFASATRTFSS